MKVISAPITQAKCANAFTYGFAEADGVVDGAKWKWTS